MTSTTPQLDVPFAQGDRQELKGFFKDAAERIEARATRTRRRGYWLSMMFFLGSYALIIVGIVRVTDIESMPYPPRSTAAAVDATMQARLSALVSDARMLDKASTTEDLAYMARQRAQLSENLKVWQRVRSIAPPEHLDSPDWYSARGLTKLLGLALLVVLAGIAIRVTLMFWSYYTRLAEFLDTQVDALRLSDGDAEMAVEFMRHFSPNVIGLGPVPKAVHEAIADALSAATKRST